MTEGPSKADLVHRQLKAEIESGALAPGTPLAELTLVERTGASRTPVREALRRLTGEGLAEFVPNRGFRAASPGLDDVLRRLEVRSLVEPGIARLAAARRSHGDLLRLQETIAREEAATTRVDAHDASRDFHLVLAGATGNPELVSVLASLWIVEIGRRLLAARATSAEWRKADVAEHRAIATAVGAQDGALAARLMTEHIGEALQHWQHEPYED
jgi:DNA-binding GntR family transcriptional regulator